MIRFAPSPASALASRSSRCTQILLSCLYVFLVLQVLAEYLPVVSAQRFSHRADLGQHELIARRGKRVEVSEALFTDNNRTDQVQWDNYSLLLRGQRIFL